MCFVSAHAIAPLRQLTNDAARIAGGGHVIGNVPSDDATGADDTPGSDRYPRTDDRPDPDPDIGPDHDRLAEYLRATQLGIERKRRRMNLHRRTKQRVIADPHVAHVEHDAVEVSPQTLESVPALSTLFV